MALAAFIALFTLNLPFPLLVLGAGLIGFAAQGAFGPLKAPPTASTAAPQNGWRRAIGIAGLWSAIWLAPLILVMLLLGETSLWAQIGLFFSKVALVAFGGAYAILAYVAQAAVQQMHWLTAPQMLDGLALAETTPGPLILVLTYVGFIAGYQQPSPFSPLFGGLVGGLLATWMSFAPCFLWVLLGAPYVERARGVIRLNSALAAIMAAMVGVILNLAVWFAFHTLFAADQTVHLGPLSLLWPDIMTFRPVVAAIAGVAALLFWRGAGLPLTLAACALLGLAAGWLGFAGV
jgi:chromate transporter